MNGAQRTRLVGERVLVKGEDGDGGKSDAPHKGCPHKATWDMRYTSEPEVQRYFS